MIPPETPTPGPMARRGPRPLALHLMLARKPWNSCAPGWPSWSSDWPPWSTSPGPGQAGVDSGWLAQPPVTEAEAEFIRGVAAYRRHPARRALPDMPEVWREGACRLLDYGGAGPPVLFVPSLINRYYILDLSAERSLLRRLAGAGLRPLVLDWGWPDPITRNFTLTDYIAGLLERAIEAVAEPVALVGYCMGGLLALAAALRRPDRVRRLALLATPWDFRGPDPAQADNLASAGLLLDPILATTGTLPIDMLQTLFALLDPDAVAAKYRRFAAQDPHSDAASLFVAIEDWANDCVPLVAAVARECLVDWYGRNTPQAGAWRVAGQVMRPEALRVPSFVALPGRDRIVPPDSARALARRLPGAEQLDLSAGHISMVIGKAGAEGLWPSLRQFLLGASQKAPRPGPRPRRPRAGVAKSRQD